MLWKFTVWISALTMVLRVSSDIRLWQYWPEIAKNWEPKYRSNRVKKPRGKRAVNVKPAGKGSQQADVKEKDRRLLRRGCV
jgi:hypothetical protein